MENLSSDAQTTILAFREYFYRTLEPPSPRPLSRRRTESYRLTSNHPLESANQNHLPQGLEEPPLSPSAITPDGVLDSDDATFHFDEEMPVRERAQSTPPGNMRGEIQVLEEIMRISGAEATSATAKQRKTIKNVSNRLITLGENIERTHQRSSFTNILRGFIAPDSSIVDAFARYIKIAKTQMSLHIIGRLFYLGIRLMQSIAPRQVCDEQQSRLLRVFINVLVDGVTSWIGQQGGWEAFLQQEVEHRRRSMPVVLPSSTPGHVPCLEPIQQQVSVEPLSSPETPPLEEGLNSLNVGASEPDRELLYTTSCPQLKQQGASPQPFSRMTSASVRIPRKRPLTLPIRRNNSLPNHSASDSPSTGSSIGNVAVSVGVGVSFGVALYAYLYS